MDNQEVKATETSKTGQIVWFSGLALCIVLTMSLFVFGPEDPSWLKQNGFILQPKDSTDKKHYQFYARDTKVDFIIYKDKRADINVYSGSPLKWEYRVEYDRIDGRTWCKIKCELSSIYRVWLNQETTNY